MLADTLESFAAQSILKNRYEVVVVDDCIADRRLLEEHLKAHKRHPQENVAVLGYTTWAPTLSVTPLMHYVTDVGRFLFAYGDLKGGADARFLPSSGAGALRASGRFLPNTAFLTASFRTSIPENRWLRRYGHLPCVGWIYYEMEFH